MPYVINCVFPVGFSTRILYVYLFSLESHIYPPDV